MAGTRHSPKTGRFIPGKVGGGKTTSYNPKTGPGGAAKISNAATMYGTGSKQHKAAIKKYKGAK